MGFRWAAAAFASLAGGQRGPPGDRGPPGRGLCRHRSLVPAPPGPWPRSGDELRVLVGTLVVTFPLCRLPLGTGTATATAPHHHAHSK